MRHRPLRRWAAALLNALFLIAWGEPVSLHPCPMHDGVAAASHGAAAGSAHGGAGAAAGHGHGAAHGVPASAPAGPDDAAGHVCQCLGTCSAASAPALPEEVAVAWQGVVRHAAEPPLVGPEAPRAASPRLLPFANGPPRPA